MLYAELNNAVYGLKITIESGGVPKDQLLINRGGIQLHSNCTLSVSPLLEDSTLLHEMHAELIVRGLTETFHEIDKLLTA